jgi:hypothetical protein
MTAHLLLSPSEFFSVVPDLIRHQEIFEKTGSSGWEFIPMKIVAE